ncbi:hypothetical protein ACFFGR_16575 [Arthrobacter liuii]|uniref:Major facilitator superfamily (MFS) profile domain-containing protein n=1 Tax=Arthrobacter liuii TaxID=1476996 RepID=A0ABQ2AXY8_9MICC|nr:hypothetical protein [Arthrobacter liuii]GGH98146.1 hypothetical protein GCM10007170_30020 [Arthrobacter liuii]
MANNYLLARASLAGIALAAAPLAYSGPGAIRAIVVGLFLLTGPGGAFILFIGVERMQTALGNRLAPLLLSLTMALSLAIAALSATIMLYVHWWNPSFAAAALAFLSLGLLALGIRKPGPRRTYSAE